jgi:hypothetical protein
LPNTGAATALGAEYFLDKVRDMDHPWGDEQNTRELTPVHVDRSCSSQRL